MIDFGTLNSAFSICGVCGSRNHVTTAHRNLNDAAPEMYKALKKANDLYTDYGLVAGDAECGAWINDVRDALAKAEGKVQIMDTTV